MKSFSHTGLGSNSTAAFRSYTLDWENCLTSLDLSFCYHQSVTKNMLTSKIDVKIKYDNLGVFCNYFFIQCKLPIQL